MLVYFFFFFLLAPHLSPQVFIALPQHVCQVTACESAGPQQRLVCLRVASSWGRAGCEKLAQVKSD